MDGADDTIPKLENKNINAMEHARCEIRVSMAWHITRKLEMIHYCTNAKSFYLKVWNIANML